MSGIGSLSPTSRAGPWLYLFSLSLKRYLLSTLHWLSGDPVQCVSPWCPHQKQLGLMLHRKPPKNGKSTHEWKRVTFPSKPNGAFALSLFSFSKAVSIEHTPLVEWRSSAMRVPIASSPKAAGVIVPPDLGPFCDEGGKEGAVPQSAPPSSTLAAHPLPAYKNFMLWFSLSYDLACLLSVQGNNARLNAEIGRVIEKFT